MSKLEEKFKELIDKEENFLSIENTLNVTKVAKDCAVLTEQECIGFAEWYFIKTFEEDAPDLTTSELFQLYQKSKEND